MTVDAVAQTTQTQPPPAVQDSTQSSDGGLFAYLLKHSFFGKSGGHGTLLDTQAMLAMVGSGPEFTPPPPPAPPPPPPQTSSGQSSANTANQGGNQQGPASAPGPVTNAAATNANGGGGSNAGSQGGDTQSQGQQQTTSNSGQASAQATQAATAPTQSNDNTDANAVDAEVAAVLAAAIYVAQQVQAPAPTASIALAGPLNAAAAPTETGPANAPQDQTQQAGQSASSGPATPAQALAAAADDTGEEAPLWSLNFLASAASIPQVAQQQAGLSQIVGQSGASISVQTTSGGPISAPSAGALVPDAVLAIPGFLSEGQQDGSDANGGFGQSANQQDGADASAQPGAIDPSILLAQEAQLLMAFTSAMQAATQEIVAAAPQAANAAVSSAAALSAGADIPAAPQPANQPGALAGQTNFAAQLQQTDETEAPQAPRQIALPAAVDQIKMQIEKGLAQGSTTIKVQLTPENLGRVEVKLDMQNGTVKATITADRPETLQLLRNDQANLLQALQDSGLNADSTSLAFYLRGDQQRQFAQAGRQGRGQTANANGGDDLTVDDVTGAPASASAGGAAGVDISV